MKTKDLLTQLESYDANTPIYIYDQTYGLYYPIIEVKQEKNNIIIVCKNVTRLKSE